MDMKEIAKVVPEINNFDPCDIKSEPTWNELGHEAGTVAAKVAHKTGGELADAGKALAGLAAGGAPQVVVAVHVDAAVNIHQTAAKWAKE